MAKRKIAVVFFVLTAFVFLSPNILIGGGNLKESIKQRINAPQKIQYNLDVSQQSGSYSDSGFLNEQEEYRKVKREKKCTDKELSGEKPMIATSPASLPVVPPLLSSHAIYKTNYQAEIEEDVVTVKGNVFFEVFKKGWTQLPLVRSNVGLIDVSINRGTSFVTMQGGKYYLMIDKPGKYNLSIEFLIKAARERENGPGNFSFEVMPAPISQFEFTMPESGVEIFVDPSIRLELTKEPKKTIAWAVMPNTNTITVRWSKALPKEVITPIKLEPKVYVDTSTYASVGDGLIRCQANLNYSILQSEISNLRVALPEDVSVLEVKGNNLRDWKVSNKEGLQYLDVYLNFGVKGNYILNLSYERKIGEGSVVAQVPWVRVAGAGIEREKGYFGLAAATNVELAVNKIEHAALIDIKELPSSIWGLTSNPILLAFKYLNHPFSIAIDVTKHEELPVLVAAIDSVDYVTLQTDEGKSLTKAIYQVRNNVKQFVHLILPNNAKLWSVFVAGKPVKPAKDKNGSILIPLEKSQLEGESLTQFPVEIVYLDNLPKMGLMGNFKLNLPQTDIPISSLSWSVYLPLDYAYFNFGGDVKQDMRASWGVGAATKMRAVSEHQGRRRYDFSATQYAPQSQVSQVVNDEFQSARMKGVLPIKIDIPEHGRLYRFSKLLVTENESPWLSVVFITVFKPLHGLVRFLIFIVILAALGIYLFKKKLSRKLIKD